LIEEKIEMSREDELNDTIIKARDELTEIKMKKEQEANAPLVGKCFKFHNSYSCPKSDDDKWWVYRKIIGVDEYGMLNAFSFETDCDGRIEIEYCPMYPTDWIEISSKEFDKEWKSVVKQVNNIRY
jgi:hypothetical protein